MNEYCTTVKVEGETKSIKDIERSIIKTYRKDLWTPFIKGINEFEMLKDGDHIAVCVSGGKDSLLLAKLLQEFQKHKHINYKLSFISMDPGFSEFNRDLLEDTCKKIGVDVDIFDTQIFEIVDNIAQDYPCYMCARMRRGALYNKAQEIGANKIALGHHFDDFIETTLINMLYSGNYGTMMPKVKALNYEGIELIRPLVYVEEKNIIRYTKSNAIRAMNCGCVVAAKQTSSKRAEVKELIANLVKVNPDVKKSIFSSSKNVNLETIIGWKKNGESHSFLEDYDEE